MSEDPFPGSSGDFYEQIQILKAEIERLKKSKNILSDLLYKMEARSNRQEQLITELADALKANAFVSKRTRTMDEELWTRAREATK
jgi:uncharacterized coiled-coil protein SlyX